MRRISIVLCVALIIMILGPVQPVYAAAASSYDNGDTLEEVIASMATQEFESLAVFTTDGNKYANVTSYLATVTAAPNSLLTDISAYNGQLFVHNHPSGSAHSSEDLRQAITAQIPWTIVVGGAYLHIVTDLPMLPAYSPEAEALGQQAKAYYHSQIQSIGQHTIDGAIYDGLPAKTWVCAQAMSHTAAEFGFSYFCIPIAEFDAETLGIFQTSMQEAPTAPQSIAGQ